MRNLQKRLIGQVPEFQVRTVIIMGTYLFFLTITAIAVLRGRVVAVPAAILVWAVFFTPQYRYGYGALALQAVVVFWVLSLAHILSFGSLERSSLLGYTGLSMALFGAAALLHQHLPRKARCTPVIFLTASSIVLSAISAIHIWHYLVFGVPITPDVYFAVFQTNVGESGEFLLEFLDARLPIVAVVGAVSIGILGYAQCRSPYVKAPLGLSVVFISVPVALLIASDANVRLLTDMVRSSLSYRNELGEFRRLRDLRTAGDLDVQATKSGRSETYVVVIGESLNRNHMGLYGYHRNTTPRLDSLHRAGELVRFRNVYSTHTNTMPSLSLALTEANRRNGLEFFSAASIVDVAKAAEIETVWITNQVLYGPFDHLVSIVAHAVDRLIPLNRNFGETAETQRYDEAAIPALKAVLAERTERNRLIVVHLIGNHTLYCRRYPGRFNRFGGLLQAGEFGQATGDNDLAGSVNCYDNSVLYNDYVVAGLVESLESHGGVAVLLYFADHGEDVLGRRGHHSGRFTYAMAEVPLLAWFSEGYRREHPARYAALSTRVDAIFGTDLIFDTVLGIAGVETPLRDELADLSGPAWSEEGAEFSFMDGTQSFLDEANVRYHQRRNFAKLAERGLLTRVLPHRVNSTGKLTQVLYDGWRSLELDLLVRVEAGQGHFEVGHDDGHASGYDFEDFLMRMPNQTGRLWLDVKNLNADNVEPLRSEMLKLDQDFGLKGRVIFESQALELLPSLASEGFHASYYLPTELLAALSAAGESEALQREAERIAEAVAKGNLSAVSFDAGLYRFVKEHLESLLPTSVVYHTWDTSLELADPSFVERLEAAEWFRDTRVKTILVTYRSELVL